MRSGFRRFLALASVFAAAFVAVSSLRSWREGRGVLGWLTSPAENGFRREEFSLTDKSPLKLDDVALLARLDTEYAALTQAVVPSVVSIDTTGLRTERMRDWFGRSQTYQYSTQGKGSGVIVTKEGHVVTNHHVVANQSQIQISCSDGKTYGARMIGSDQMLDIAVLKIESNGPFQPLKLGDSNEVRVGQMVFAIGNPFGLGETVTQGIISAKERSLSDTQRDLFQTDAAINPGNSGGPLVNLRGEIIGINAAIYSPDRSNPGFQGVGFSIPSNDVKASLLQILERGAPIRGYLGVRLADLDERYRRLLKFPGNRGVVILEAVAGSPAEKAGLKQGDVVTSVNDTEVRATRQMISLLQQAPIGSEVRMRVWRAGQELDLAATVVETPAEQENAQANPTPRVLTKEELMERLGVEVRPLTQQEYQSGMRGVAVSRIDAESPMRSRLEEGDLVLAIHNQLVSSTDAFYETLAALVSVQSAELYVKRGEQHFLVRVPPLGRSTTSSTPDNN